MMAESSGGSIDLASLVRANEVEALHFTVCSGPVKFLVWTRLSEDHSFWTINATDGVDVWQLQLDQEQLNSHRELAEVDKYETYFSRFRSAFQQGNLLATQLANKITLTIGSGIASLYYDLYESKASDRKTELQTLLFLLADKVSDLTEKLKVSNESLERLKTQKVAAATGSSIFDIPPKKACQAPPVKRKQGHSLINPGSRKYSEEAAIDGENTENNVHISVLARDQTLDIYKCTDMACVNFCTKTNKRYHCPLCNNKPQKPGRMRRHFEKMHSGKQIVQHEGYQMLRCRLRCTKANGRITDNSHYHCCLCGRVLVRKVHLYCHLQAHPFGTMREIDMMLDAKDETEEGPLDDTIDDDDEDTVEDSTLATSEISGLADSEEDNVVALSDGTRVVFVQSIQDSETLTVVPLDGQTDTMQITQEVDQPGVTTVVSTASDLNSAIPDLSAVSAGASVSDVDGIQQQLPQQLSVKQVEAMLNQGGQDAKPSSLETESSKTDLQMLDQEVNSLEALTCTSQPTQNMSSDTDGVQTTALQSTKLPKDFHEPMEFEPCLDELPVSEADNSTVETAASTDLSGLQQESSEINQAEADSDMLESQSVGIESPTVQMATSTPVAMIQTATSSAFTVQESKEAMRTPVARISSFEDDGRSQRAARKQQVSHQDLLVLFDSAEAPQGDDHVFKVLLTNIAPATSCFNHPSVLNEKNSMDVRRCKNTDCDCRLYHCPLCTCLPNKPGRIKEHFKKIHAQELVIRYQGFQMLRCKLGCCRPSGKKVFNSHYHCCLCGMICIRKSGVYEHMRVNHSSGSSQVQPMTKKSLLGIPDVSKKGNKEIPTKSEGVQDPPVSSGVPASEMQQVQTTQAQSLVSAAACQQAVTVQIPQQGLTEGQPQQQVVILMPQQMNHGQPQGTVQNQQQPIVIVMPQAGSTQLTQPIVVPVPQPSSIN